MYTTNARGDATPGAVPPTVGSRSAENRRAGVCVGWVEHHVDDHRTIARKRLIQRGAYLARFRDQKTISPHGLRHLVVAGGRPEIGHHVVSEQCLHMVLLEPPAIVVAHDGDNR